MSGAPRGQKITSEWAERYGMCADRFGVQWMLNYTGGRS